VNPVTKGFRPGVLHLLITWKFPVSFSLCQWPLLMHLPPVWPKTIQDWYYFLMYSLKFSNFIAVYWKVEASDMTSISA
jgi:hypothetical protein